jgi:B12-binding domain/radical SAM domain protein
MPRDDLVLLHAPSVYDFRKRAMLFGPVSDVVPSTQVFEMYPIGFLTMLEYLQRHGYSVRIINVALRMLRSRRFDAEKLIKSLHPVAFGLDLHWLVHAQGSLELASIIKKHHPEIPVIMGGLSASYFHEELVRYPQVDYVIRGDSAEEPLRQLMRAIKEKRPLDDVPNLTWQDAAGLRVNALAHVPSDLDGVSFDYRKMIKSSVRHVDVLGHLPFLAWPSYPIVPSLPCRGCVHNCVTCGGSSSAYRSLCHRRAPAYRSPKLLAQDIAAISRYMRGPVMALGDIRQGGLPYAEAFLEELAHEKVRNHIAFEFFGPPSREFLEKVARAIPHFSIQISPESHDEEVRRAFGRTYDNGSLEACIHDALDLGCKRLDLFFMLGLPEQTPESVRETIRYCESLLSEFDRSHPRKILPFISPLAPFLDPGSRAFEDPQKHGYRLFHRSLEDHRLALLSPSWKYTLNYETEWMSRDELAASTYEAALGLTRMKQTYGFLSREVAQGLEKRIEQEWTILDKLDEILLLPDSPARDETIRKVMRKFDHIGPATLCGKNEMNWPAGFLRFNPLRVIQGAFFGD